MSCKWFSDKKYLVFLKQINYDPTDLIFKGKNINYLPLPSKIRSYGIIYGDNNNITRLSKKFKLPLTSMSLCNNQLTYIPKQLISSLTQIYLYHNNPIDYNLYTDQFYGFPTFMNNWQVNQLRQVKFRKKNMNEKMKLWNISLI